MAVSLTFLGAAGTVTGSKYLVDAPNRRLLLDAGMFQGEKKWREMNWDPFPVPPASIQDVILTHAHADHTAYLPKLVADGFAGTIWCTEGTRRLAEIILMDAGHLQEKEARYAAEGGYSKHNPPLPLYTAADAEKTIPLFKTVAFDTNVDIGGATVRFTRAGHILGSASVSLTIDDSHVLFSGDLGRPEHPVLRSRDTPPGAPFVLVESTYGDREHPDPEGFGHDEMADAITRTIGRGGSVVIPAFAIDRTELVLKALFTLRSEGRIPADVPIFVNSPMAVAALAVYRDGEARGELRSDIQPDDFLDLPTLREVTDPEESKRLNHPDKPSIIVSSSGMATGGRVLHHLEAMLPDPKNCVIFTGYQGVGTRGRTLLDGATEMKFRGRFIPVKAEIVQDREFSVHADASDVIDWLRDLSPQPETVFVTHGESGSAKELAARIREELSLTAVVPSYREKVSLKPTGTWEPLEPGEQVAEPPGVEVSDTITPTTTTSAASGKDAAPAPAPSTKDDDGREVQVILDTAAGQVPFLPAEKQKAVAAAISKASAVAAADTLDRPRLAKAVNEALYAATGSVETPGGQSIVALLGHAGKILA